MALHATHTKAHEISRVRAVIEMSCSRARKALPLNQPALLRRRQAELVTQTRLADSDSASPRQACFVHPQELPRAGLVHNAHIMQQDPLAFSANSWKLVPTVPVCSTNQHSHVASSKVDKSTDPHFEPQKDSLQV